MTITRRLLLRNTAVAAGAAAATVAAPVVAAEPKTTPRERAVWHMGELERLVSEDGGGMVTVTAIADYGDDSGYNGCRLIGICDGQLTDNDGMFAPKGGEA